MKSLKKALIFIIVIVLLVGLGFGGYYLYNKNNTETKKSKENDQTIIDDEDSWFKKLNIRLIELFNEKYPMDYDFDLDDGEHITFTLKDLRDLEVDISEFNTDIIHCDEDTSRIVITKDGDEYQRMTALDCTNDEEE